jgi:hypothetical protein
MGAYRDDDTGVATYMDSRGAEAAPISFREALSEVISLAGSNLPDDIDAAFGDDGIPEMAARQMAALDTLASLLTDRADAVDALDARSAAGSWPGEVVGADADLDPSVPSHAIRICLLMAEQVAVDPSDVRGIAEAEEADRQQLAFDVARDLLGMHAAALDAPRAPDPFRGHPG